MNLYTTNKKDKINYYKIDDVDIQKIILGRYNKPTIARRERCIDGAENKLYFQGDDVCFITLESQEYLGSWLQSNVGVACNPCDHYYEDVYRYHYMKHFLLPELASAIQGYYAVRDLDITKARACLNKIGECLKCDTIDIRMMIDILDYLKITETKTFTNLEEFTKSFLMLNDWDRIYRSHDYEQAIKGLTINDLLRSNYESLTYPLSILSRELAKSNNVQELLNFMPEIEAKRRELSTAFERCRKHKGYC